MIETVGGIPNKVTRIRRWLRATAYVFTLCTCIMRFLLRAGPCNAIGSASDSRVSGSGFGTRSDHILSFLLPLIQERQLSVTGKSMCTKYWLTA